MTLKTTLSALALIALPAISFAMCSERGHQAQSCAPGTVWDANTQSCVEQVSG
ncbi:MAG: hypothetical protein KDK29_18505 [Sedimentitalea sp.]|nr:hypothetical protein [Sedimentitalea sp.]